MRDAAFACIRRVGVETGGSNVQFALDPTNGDMVIIEMNPRVSRSSALASKATGFPIAKIAAKLAVGYTLDEIPNDITKATPASFEPTIDYVVTKVPRWAFEKFPGTPGVLGTSMQSVGEAMAIGRTFPESRCRRRCARLEHGRLGLACDPAEAALDDLDDEELLTPGRHRHARPALPARGGAAARHHASRCSPSARRSTRGSSTRSSPSSRSGPPRRGRLRGMDRRAWRRAKRLGFSDAQLGWLWSVPEAEVRAGPAGRRRAGHLQDRRHLRGRVRGRDAVPLLHLRGRGRGHALRPRRRCSSSAPGPNRIGQGIEFDYCCVHASFALADAGLRDGHAQLQPGDGVDRLRHVRPPLLRAAHPRGRPQRHRGRAGAPAPSRASSSASAVRRR